MRSWAWVEEDLFGFLGGFFGGVFMSRERRDGMGFFSPSKETFFLFLSREGVRPGGGLRLEDLGFWVLASEDEPAAVP